MVILPAGATLIVLSTPPVMYDVLHYHLAFPEQWLIHGGFVEFSRESFSYYSSAHGTLYAFALSTVGPWGASAINWWMAAVATVAAATLGERLGGPRAGAWAAACFACTPATLEIADYAIADHAVAGWAGAALVVLLSGQRRSPEPGRVALAAALAASAAAAKYLALATVVLPVALATTVARLASDLRPDAAARRPCARFRRCRLHCRSHRGWGAISPGPEIPSTRTSRRSLGGPPSVLDMATEIDRNLDLPESAAGRLAGAVGALAWRTFSPRAEGGLLGPHWLILLPLAVMVVGLRPDAKTALWVATLSGLLAWGFLVQYARFLLPALVPGAALAGAAAAALTRGIGRASRIAFTALLVADPRMECERRRVEAQPRPPGRRHRAIGGERLQGPVVRRSARRGLRSSRTACRRPHSARRRGTIIRARPSGPGRRPLPHAVVGRARDTAPSAASLAEAVRTLGATHILVNQNEMPRFARVRKVPDYFFGASEGQRVVIKAVLRDHVERLFAHDGVWIGRITDPPAGVQPRDTDRADTASTDPAEE